MNETVMKSLNILQLEKQILHYRRIFVGLMILLLTLATAFWSASKTRGPSTLPRSVVIVIQHGKEVVLGIFLSGAARLKLSPSLASVTALHSRWGRGSLVGGTGDGCGRSACRWCAIRALVPVPRSAPVLLLLVLLLVLLAIIVPPVAVAMTAIFLSSRSGVPKLVEYEHIQTNSRNNPVPRIAIIINHKYILQQYRLNHTSYAHQVLIFY